MPHPRLCVTPCCSASEVTKEPLLRYELYVVSDRQPLMPRGTWHLGGTQPAAAEEAAEGSADGAVAEVPGGCALGTKKTGLETTERGKTSRSHQRGVQSQERWREGGKCE